jgi:hypothetical protein
MGGLESGLLAQFGTKGTSDLLAIVPPLNSVWMPVFTLVVYFGIMWWADARVEGGAYVAHAAGCEHHQRPGGFAKRLQQKLKGKPKPKPSGSRSPNF